MSGTIEPLHKARVVERQDHRIGRAWVRSAESITPSADGRWLTHQDERAVHGDVDEGPVLIMLGSASSPALAALEAHGGAGARTYVLAPSRWSPASRALVRHPKVLIRRIGEVPLSAVLTPAGAEIWMGATAGGAASWRLRLCDAQAAALRQLFLRLFWHEAIDEAWTGGSRLAFRAAAERPFDVPELPSSATARLMTPDVTLDAFRAESRVLLNQGPPPSSGALQRLWIPPSGIHHGALARLASDGAAVGWEDRDLPDLATDGESGQVLLPGTRGRLRLALSPGQAAELMALLDAPTAWSFQLDVRLGDHVGDGAQLWLEGAAEARLVEAEQVIDLPDARAAELRDMEDASPMQWPEPHPLSATVRHRWTVRPPRAPTGAKVDALIGRWQEVDADWSSRLDALGQSLAAADEERGRVGKAFARLAGALLGFQRKHADLSAEVEDLARRRPSESGPVESAAMFRQLTELETHAGRLRADQEEEEHKARELEAREQQELAWRARVDAARHGIPGKQAEATDLEHQRLVLAANLEGVDEALPSADKKAIKDLKARRHKLRDELARLDRSLQGRRDELARLEQDTTEAFAFTPPPRPKPPRKASAGRFVPTQATPAERVVPDESLPEVGSLRSLKGERYLVIDIWEHLELGEQAAQRLHAHLVAPEGS